MLLIFEDPLWLIGLALVPLFLLYDRHYAKRKYLRALSFSKVSLARAAAGSSGAAVRVHRIAFALGLLALALIFVGLANPVLPLEQTKDGVNVVLALDISGSMQATDYSPDRITAAKTAAEDLIGRLDPKDYVGIVTFDSGATTAAYLSPDHDRVVEKLRYVEAGDGSTAIGDGLALAVEMAQAIPNRRTLVILLSDGDSNAGYISPEKAAAFAKERGVQVFAVAMGSDDPVLVGYDWANNPEYATVNEVLLKEIANTTGGVYFRAVDAGTLESIYANLGDAIVREQEDTPVGWVLFVLAACLLTVEFLVRYGRWRFFP
ncbi:MAG: Ca-activated chloride channel [Methanofollis sp.]|nr:Ca-activated chloride channel [Methanofollis sp.]